MKGARIAAEWLKAQGVTHVFALCGEHVLPLLDSCEEIGIRVIGTRHEQAAVLAAEAFARVTGRPGVAVVTAGPGVTNAMTGLAVAQTCGSPVMLLAGRTSTAKRLTGTFQDVDGRAIVQAVTKWTDTAPQAERIPVFLEAAWRRMLSGRPGAVMVELPYDVQSAEAEAEIRAIERPQPAGASPEAVAKAAQILGHAERPIAVVGSGAFWSGATDALTSFAERTQTPVATLNAARGLLPDGHEACIGPLSEAGLALMQADVVLLVGSKLDTSLTFGGPPLFAATPRLVQIDIEPSWVGLNVQPELGIHGDAAVALEQITDAWDAKPKDGWLQMAKQGGEQMHQTWFDLGKVEGSPVPPARVPAAIVEEAGRDAILVSDGGDIHTLGGHDVPGLPTGIAAHDPRLARNDRRRRSVRAWGEGRRSGSERGPVHRRRVVRFRRDGARDRNAQRPAVRRGHREQRRVGEHPPRRGDRARRRDERHRTVPGLLREGGRGVRGTRRAGGGRRRGRTCDPPCYRLREARRCERAHAARRGEPDHGDARRHGVDALSDASDHDVIVVGAGPAGAIVATHLAERGRRVLLLEAGPDFPDRPPVPDDRPQDPGHRVRTRCPLPFPFDVVRLPFPWYRPTRTLLTFRSRLLIASIDSVSSSSRGSSQREAFAMSVSSNSASRRSSASASRRLFPRRGVDRAGIAATPRDSIAS